jgi:glycine dehydrogenase subunit 1
MAVERHMARLSAESLTAGEAPFFLGAGAYRHHVPASVDHLIQRGEFLTAYTPYQPEIAQGTLQVLFEFQTQVARLFGTDIANASLYDGSTACWEAIAMAGRITRRKKAVLSGGLHPHYVETARTMARFTGDALVTSAPVLAAAADDDAVIAAIDADTACVVVQYPDVLGRIPDLADRGRRAGAGRAAGGGGDRAGRAGPARKPGAGRGHRRGEGQSLGVGLQFGGPYLGLFGCREKFVRQMPGRLCGETVDAEGRRGFVLTLSTREQHIRREGDEQHLHQFRPLRAGVLDPSQPAGRDRAGAHGTPEPCPRARTADRLAHVPGVEIVNTAFFNEFAVTCRAMPGRWCAIWRTARCWAACRWAALSGRRGARQWSAGGASECTTAEDIEALGTALEEVLA